MWGCRVGRIEGILRVIGADAAEPERVQRAEASVSSLMQQLTELQKQEQPLSEQVSGRASLASALKALYRVYPGSTAAALQSPCKASLGKGAASKTSMLPRYLLRQYNTDFCSIRRLFNIGNVPHLAW